MCGDGLNAMRLDTAKTMSHHGFRDMLDTLPSSPLRIIAADDERSARTLADDVERCAEALNRVGARRVASRLDNGPAWLTLELALRRLDGVHIPLPTFFTPQQIEHALRTSGAEGVAIALQHEKLAGSVADWLEQGLVSTPSGELRSDATGHVVVEGIPRGTYELSYVSSSGEPRSAQAPVPAHAPGTLQIRL